MELNIFRVHLRVLKSFECLHAVICAVSHYRLSSQVLALSPFSPSLGSSVCRLFAVGYCVGYIGHSCCVWSRVSGQSCGLSDGTLQFLSVCISSCGTGQRPPIMMDGRRTQFQTKLPESELQLVINLQFFAMFMLHLLALAHRYNI